MHPVTSATLSPWTPQLLSFGFYVAIVLGMLIVLLFLTSWLGEKKPAPEKARPYECGIIPTGPAHFRYPVPFYLVAVFFLIFDVEAAFIFAWAVAMGELNWLGWLQISYFIIVLLLSLFYIWRKGGLDWRPKATFRRISPKT